jgi:hypothetical protein
MEHRSIPYVSIQHKKLVTYSMPVERNSSRRHSFADNTSEVHKQAYKSGTLTKGARKRLKASIELLIDISPKKWFTVPSSGKRFQFQITFLTLTLSSSQNNIPDKTIIKTLLEPLLQQLRRKYKCKSYVWRAEKQKNGNLHFHITTNQYIPYDTIRDDWNRIQNKLGFIDQFETKYGHSNPNSTDIHSVRGIRDLARYMVKYMSKEVPPNQIVNCKQWDCSLDLKIRANISLEIDSTVHEQLCAIIQRKGVRTHLGDRYSLIEMRGFDIRQILPEPWIKLYNSFIDYVQTFVPKLTAPYVQPSLHL